MATEKQPDPKRWSRQEVAEKLAEYDQDYLQTPSQRQLAEQLDVPRSTLQYWLARKKEIEAGPELVAFFESPVGLAFLHRLVLAAHMVITLVGPGGIRLVCLFLELTGLNHFVAASYRPHCQVSVALEQAIDAFDQAEKDRLGQNGTKQIAVCEDETFHPATCLVAIEPVSFHSVGTVHRRPQQPRLGPALIATGLPIEVIQSTSDEGRCLFITSSRPGVHHSPDLFHVQHEPVWAPVCFGQQVRQATKVVQKAPPGGSTALKKPPSSRRPTEHSGD
jgi:hypothetical protein